MARGAFPRGGVRARLPVMLRRLAVDEFDPTDISGLALWLDASATDSLFTTDAGPVTAVSSPLDIATPALWLDASDAASITESGGLVSQWSDKSGNNRHATAISTARPTTGTRTVGGKNALDFNGTANSMATGGSAFPTAATHTVFLVYQLDSASQSRTSVLLTAATIGEQEIRVAGFGSTAVQYVFNNNLGTTMASTAIGLGPIVFSAREATASMRSAGAGVVSTTSGSAFAWSSGSMLIGSRTAGNYVDGLLCEVIIYPTTLTDSQTASVESYLAAKWGISGVHRSAAQEIAAVNAPTDIAGLTEWFDATDTATVTLSGGKVSSWASKVAGGRTLTQATDSLRPVMTDNIQNGLRMAKFDGVDDFIRTTTPEAFGDKTVFIVARPTDVSASQAVWGASKQNITLYGYYYSAGFRVNGAATLVRPETAAASARRIAASANEAIITSLQFKTSELLASNFASIGPYKNGTLFDTIDSVTLADYAIGSTMGANDQRPASGFLSNFYSGYVGEVLIYDAYLSAVDRARVEKYLQQKWATTTVPDPTPPVGAWLDKSGNGRHAVQATAGSRPTISATTQNGRKALAFDGSNGWMRTERTTYAARSVFTVFRRTGTATTYSSPFAKQSNVAAGYGGSSYAVAYGNEGGWSIVGSGTGRMNYSSNGSPHKLSAAYMRGAAMPLADAQNYLTGIVAAPNTTDAELLYAEAATDTDGNQAWFLGTEPFATTRKYPANILEVLIYNRALTVTERQRLERYLAARWGITLAPTVSNADAQDWINRVYSNGGSVTSSTAAAVNTLCDSLDASGVRPLMYRMGIFAGTGLNAALVPLYRGPSLGGTQYGGTTDTNVGPFVSGDYSETTGLLGNGSSKYLNTGFDASAAGLSASGGVHLSVVIPTYAHPAGGNWFPIAVINSGATERFWINNNSFAANTSVESYLGSTGASLVNYQVAATNGATISGGLWTVNRSSATDLRLYNGTSQQGSTQTANVSASVMPTLPLTVFARWNGTTPFGYFGNGSVGRIMAYSVGLSMTGPQLTSFNNAMAAFNSALTRNV